MNIIPNQIQTELANYISKKCPHAESSWEFSNQDEDTITGDFLGNLRTEGWLDSNGIKFRIAYNKFRGRGKNALEKEVGADGIITVELNESGETTYKSFVFQAKKEGNKTDKSQVDKMNFLLPKGNIIFRYSSKGYVVENYHTEMGICKFITDIFLKCNFGIIGLRYDPNQNRIKQGNFALKSSKYFHQLTIEIDIQ